MDKMTDEVCEEVELLVRLPEKVGEIEERARVVTPLRRRSDSMPHSLHDGADCLRRLHLQRTMMASALPATRSARSLSAALLRRALLLSALLATFSVGAQVTSPCTIALEPFPQGVAGVQGDFLSTAIGDLDNDGLLDFVVGGATTGPFSFYFGAGSSSLSAEALDLGVTTRGAEIGDFDEDGNKDVIVATDQAELRLLFGDGNRTFVTETIALASGQSILGIEGGDLNGDDHLDVVLYGSASLTTLVVVLLGVGDGTFVELPSFIIAGGAPSSVNLLDWNDDGDLDLIVPNATGGVLFYLGDGVGGFDFDFASVVPTPITVAPGDFNGDQVLDLAVALFSSNEFAVIFGEGMGVAAPPQFFPLSQTAFIPQIVAADLNGDGLDDLAVTSNVINAVQTVVNSGGSFMPSETTPLSHWATLLEAADFDGDGQEDLLLGRTDAVTIMRNRSIEQSDCNGNGVADRCDIMQGSSIDANLNDIPDECETPFVRGDDNGDGSLGLTDPIFTLNYLFSAGPSFCLGAQDSNGDGVVELVDPIYNLTYQFFAGNAPPAPFPGCGIAPGAICDLSPSCP